MAVRRPSWERRRRFVATPDGRVAAHLVDRPGPAEQVELDDEQPGLFEVEAVGLTAPSERI